ncbi:unnamed protein product [Durusdinium trenchii]|uniref:Rhomboid-like protein n=1 Tax=Durusdinium trenchii TaxID=1381693 RepID=A0ABP0J0H5_9DINO
MHEDHEEHEQDDRESTVPELRCHGRLRAWVLKAINFVTAVLALTNFLRTSWTINSLTKSGATYVDQWETFGERIKDPENPGAVFREGSPSIAEMSSGMQKVIASQLGINGAPKSHTVTLHMMDIHHYTGSSPEDWGNNRCRNMRGTYELDFSSWTDKLLVFSAEETMLVGHGVKGGEHLRDTTENPILEEARGLWFARKSVDLRVLGAIEVAAPENPLVDGETVQISATLPGQRFNIKTTCNGCEVVIVHKEYHCDIVANLSRTGDRVSVAVFESAASTVPGLDRLKLGISFTWTWGLVLGDMLRGVSQLVMFGFWLLYSQHGLAPGRLIQRIEEALEDGNRVKKRKTFRQVLQGWNFLPARVGRAFQGIPIYFYVHNGWFHIVVNVLSLFADGLVTVAYIRESATYTFFPQHMGSIYWMCIYGLRFMWIQLLVFKSLKHVAVVVRWKWASRALTFAGYTYFVGTLFANYAAEEIALRYYGEEIEFKGLPSVVDSASVSYQNSFYFLRVGPYLLSLLYTSMASAVINIAANSWTMRNSNSLNAFLIEGSTIVNGEVGLTWIQSERGKVRFLADVGTMLQVAWVVNNSATDNAQKRFRIFNNARAITPASVKQMMARETEEEVDLQAKDAALV